MLKHQHIISKKPDRVIILGSGGFISNSVQRKLQAQEINLKLIPRKSLDLIEPDSKKELSKIFGENGVKKSIISGIIKPINFFINENIGKMNLPFQVSLDETFNANIKHFGMDIEQDSLSTGESKLINLSILIAYLKLIRTKKNINILK